MATRFRSDVGKHSFLKGPSEFKFGARGPVSFSFGEGKARQEAKAAEPVAKPEEISKLTGDLFKPVS